jgi:hypothetical protein
MVSAVLASGGTTRQGMEFAVRVTAAACALLMDDLGVYEAGYHRLAAA